MYAMIKQVLLFTVFLVAGFCSAYGQKYAIAYHGGAGVLSKEKMNEEARDISALIDYQNLNITEACKKEISKLSELEGTGGVIAVDANGTIAMEFNTSGMFRGYIKSSGEKEIAIFKNE